MRLFSRAFVALSLISVSLVACSSSGDSPAAVDNTPASIRFSGSTAISLQSGQTTTLSATVSAHDGHSIAGAPIIWSSSDASVASVAAGLVTAAKVGTATITATSGSATASATVTVSAGAVTRMAIRTQPVGATIGSALATQPVLELQDDAGNIVTSSTTFITAAIASGTGTLGGTTIVSAVGGVVTFTNLSISGTAGAFTLKFTAGTLSQTSSSFTMAAPPTPVIVVDKPALAISVSRGANPPLTTVAVTNGGVAALTGLTLEPIVYDAGQPTGWLQAALSSASAPSVLSLTVTSASLVEGTYRATVKIDAPGATNTPQSVVVTLTVAASYSLTYGGSNERVTVLNTGAAFTPATSVNDLVTGAPASGVAVTYASRSGTIASVGADGRITARAAGDAWIVASAPGVSDSVFVIVPTTAAGPVLRAIATNYSARAGDTLVVSIVLDTRGATVGAASVGIELNVSVGGTYSVPTSSPTPVLGTNTSGVYRVSVGAAAGMSGSVALLNFKLVGRTTGTTGYINMYALDVSAVDGSSMNTQTTSTRFPVVIK